MIDDYISFNTFWKENKQNYPNVKFDSEYDELKYKGTDNNKKVKNEEKVPEIDICHPVAINSKIYYEIRYSSDNKEYCINNSKDILSQVKQKHKGIQLKLCIVIADYFKLVINSEIHETYHLSIYGWNRVDKIFEFDNSSYLQPTIHPVIFRLRRSEPLSDEDMIHFLRQMQDYNIELKLLIVYGLLSVSTDIFQNDKERLFSLFQTSDPQTFSIATDRATNYSFNTAYWGKWNPASPSICIWGKNNNVSRIEIANDFLNYFKSDLDHPNSACNYPPHIRLSKVDNYCVNSFVNYRGLPILIRPSNNRKSIGSSANNFSYIDQLRAIGYTQIFPVYISERPIMHNGVLNVNISNVSISKKNLRNNATVLETVLWYYIQFIKCLANRDFPSIGYREKYLGTQHNYFFTNIFIDACESFDKDIYDIDKSICNRHFLIAAKRFQYYIENEYPSSKIIIESIVDEVEAWLKSDALYCEEETTFISTIPKISSKNTREILSALYKEISSNHIYDVEYKNDYIMISQKAFEAAFKRQNKTLSFNSFRKECRDKGYMLVRVDRHSGAFKQYYFESLLNHKKVKHYRIPINILK